MPFQGLCRSTDMGSVRPEAGEASHFNTDGNRRGGSALSPVWEAMSPTMRNRAGSSWMWTARPCSPAMCATGAASRLMAGVMEIARAEGLTVRPLCSYASAWMWRHREYHDLLG